MVFREGQNSSLQFYIYNTLGAVLTVIQFKGHNMESKFTRKSIISLVARGGLIGVFAGLVTVLYRWLLGNAEGFLFKIINIVKGSPAKTALWLISLGLIGVIVSLIIKSEPDASGSGIPQIAGEVKGFFSPSLVESSYCKARRRHALCFFRIISRKRGAERSAWRYGGKGRCKNHKGRQRSNA